MSEQQKDLMLEKIQKLLNLSDKTKNKSDAEAQEALLKAHELMAKYNISMSEVGEDKGEGITEIVTESKYDMNYRNGLANIIAKNFRCELYLKAKKHIVFVGHPIDAEIARDSYEFIYKYILRKGTQLYERARKETGSGKGIWNSYSHGFLTGLGTALEKQSVALMVVTPEDVKNKFAEMSANWGRSSQRRRATEFNAEAYETGYRDGTDVLSTKQIAG